LKIEFRNAQYDIKFSNKDLIKNAKVIEITVDGCKIEGSLITPFNDGVHKIKVILG
jgi:cellobiose phosphorylase